MAVANARVHPGKFLVPGIQPRGNATKRSKRHHFLKNVGSAMHGAIIPNTLALERDGEP